MDSQDKSRSSEPGEGMSRNMMIDFHQRSKNFTGISSSGISEKIHEESGNSDNRSSGIELGLGQSKEIRNLAMVNQQSSDVPAKLSKRSK